MAFSIEYIYEIADRFTVPLKKMEDAGGKFDSQIEKIQGNLMLLEDKTDGVNSSMRYVGNNFNDASVKASNLGSKTSTVKDKFEKLKSSMSNFGDKFNSRITKVQKGLGNLQNKFRSTGEKMANLQTGLASLGAGAFLKSALDDAVEYGDGIARIGTLIPKQKARLDSLKGTISQLSMSMGKDVNDIAGGAFDVISAFGEMEGETEKRLAAVANASVAGGASTSEALSLLSAVTKSYGDTSGEALQKASDLAFMTNVLGQTTFPEMAASMGKLLPLTAQMAVSQEEVFASMASLTGVTGNTSEVTTQLAAMMSALIKPTEDMKNTINGLGFESAKAMLQEKGLAGTLDLLAQKTNGSEEAVGKLFGSKEAMTAFFALSGAQANKFKDSLVAMGEAALSNGQVTQDALNEMMDAPGYKLGQMSAKFNNLKIAMGDIVATAITPLLEKFSAFATTLMQSNPEIIKMITYFLMGVTAVGAILIPLGLLISSIGSVIGVVKGAVTAIKLVNAVMLANPALLVVAGIAALIAIGVLLYKNWDHVKILLGFIWEKMKGFGSWVSDIFLGIWQSLGSVMISMWEKVGEVASVVWGGIKTSFSVAVDFIRTYFFTFADVLLTTFGNVFKTVVGLASKIGGALGLDVSGLEGMITKVQDLQTSIRDKSLIGGSSVMSPYINTTPQAPIPAYGGGANANANATVSVYTEKGMGVKPWQPSGDLGYNMTNTYQRGL